MFSNSIWFLTTAHQCLAVEGKSLRDRAQRQHIYNSKHFLLLKLRQKVRKEISKLQLLLALPHCHLFKHQMSLWPSGIVPHFTNRRSWVRIPRRALMNDCVVS